MSPISLSSLTDFVRVLRGSGRIQAGARSGLLRFRPSFPAIVLAAAVAVTLAIAGAAVAQSEHSNPWLLTWIPASCCVTNDCCWEVSESELRPLAGDRWEVLATSQVVKRTDWTPDGKFYRCACDLQGVTWVKHNGANTRCLFVPLRSASL